MKTYVFDLDDTIAKAEKSYATAGRIEGMRELMADLLFEGHNIYIHTGRHMLHEKTTRDWLERHSIPYHAIFYGKPVGDFYIDDKAVKFDGDVKKLRKELL